MDNKPLFQYIFDMLDYAEIISTKIDADDYDKNNYFMTLVYIEDILDKYGRGLVSRSAGEEGLDSREYLRLATERMDKLRAVIRELSQSQDFDNILKVRGESFYQDWRRRPAEM